MVTEYTFYKNGKKAVYIRLQNDLNGLWLNKKGGHPITLSELEEEIKEADSGTLRKKEKESIINEYKFDNDSYIRVGKSWYNTQEPCSYFPYTEVLKQVKRRKKNGENYIVRKESLSC